MLTLKQKREDFWGLSNDNVAIQGIIFTQSTTVPTQQSHFVWILKRRRSDGNYTSDIICHEQNRVNRANLNIK